MDANLRQLTFFSFYTLIPQEDEHIKTVNKVEPALTQEQKDFLQREDKKLERWQVFPLNPACYMRNKKLNYI